MRKSYIESYTPIRSCAINPAFCVQFGGTNTPCAESSRQLIATFMSA